MSIQQQLRYRGSLSQMFFKIGVLKNFAIFTGKHLCWSLFLIKLIKGLKSCNFIKKRLQHRFFPVNIAKFLSTAFFYRTLPVAASKDKFLISNINDNLTARNTK